MSVGAPARGVGAGAVAPVFRAFVGMGSNLGDRAAHLRSALRAMGRLPGTRVVAVSRLYETAPVGGPPQGAYLNAVAVLCTSLGPGALLLALQSFEAAAGRVRSGVRDAPRCLDLDVLLHGERVVREPGLEVPHPRLHERAFVLEPLAELAPDLVHPLLGLPMADLAERVRSPHAVRAVGEEEETSWPSSP